MPSVSPACTRRAFLGGALALVGTGVAGCGQDGGREHEGSAAAATSQVIVAMNADSEPAAGFDPLVAWGCG